LVDVKFTDRIRGPTAYAYSFCASGSTCVSEYLEYTFSKGTIEQKVFKY